MINCGTCRYYAMDEQTEKMSCKRFPPQVVVFNAPEPDLDGLRHHLINAISPPVDATDWCGEHIERPR